MDLEEFNRKAKEIFENKVVPQIIKAKMKQTAVEWLVEQCGLKPDGKLVIQAKQMEKEQIIEARMDGINSALKGYAISNEQYYNETFKSE
jgi:hypothetical protein